MRKKRPLERTPGMLRDTTLIIIASEDRYAVKQYFEMFRSNRIKIRVLGTEDNNSSPSHVMARLEKYMKEYHFGEGDIFWLVCDTDHWIEPNHISNLTKVLQLCNQKGIKVALSNPCFDLWLLLHFAEFPQDDELNCNEVGNKIREAVG